MLVIKSLNKFIGKKQILKNISFSIKEGEIFGLIGRNGAGKSTIFKSILNLATYNCGHISWNGEKIDILSLKNIGYLPEQRSLSLNSTVYSSVYFFGKLKGMSFWKIRKAWKFWAGIFEISEYKHTKISRLSKGNQQKIQILSSIIHKPKLIIMDEPFSGLDPINRKNLIDIMKRLLKLNCSILFSTHNLLEIEQFCERIAILNEGEIVYYGKIEEIKEKYSLDTVTLKLLHKNKDFEDKMQKVEKSKTVKVLRTTETSCSIRFKNSLELKKFIAWTKKIPGVSQLSIDTITLNEIFIDLITKHDKLLNKKSINNISKLKNLHMGNIKIKKSKKRQKNG